MDRDHRSTATTGNARRNLRVKAVEMPPDVPARDTADDSDYLLSPPPVSSEEEWVDSATETASNTSSQSKQGRSEGLTHPRSVQDEGRDEGEIEVFAPPLQRSEFESWEDLESYLSEYMKQTYQSFRVRTNNTVAARNNKIRSTGSKRPLLPVEWENYGKTFICTHSGRYKPRGKGKRKRQQSRAIECGAQINACVQVQDKSIPTFVLRVTSARLVHNHPLNKRTFYQYPHVRTALEPDVLSTVNELRKAGAKKKRILKYIHDNSEFNPSNQDVHNLVRKLKTQENTANTSAKRLKQWMFEFSEEPGNVGRIFVDSVHNKTLATCITLQTKHMREIFERFPEVVMIDATHGTNVSKYKVFSIMAHDAFGKGQFVQHAIVQNERLPTLLTALEEFKRNNTAWTRMKCILIDKDFTEISVLKMAFPDTTVLLCQFHVLKYLREEISSSDYGFLPWQKQQLHAIMNCLVYAKTEREFTKYRKFMGHIISIGSGGALCGSGLISRSGELGAGNRELGAGNRELGAELGTNGNNMGSICAGMGAGAHEEGMQVSGAANSDEEVGEENGANDAPKHLFETYFTKNWDSCRPMWCAFERQNAVTMGNNTNNRIEASWKQLKDLVDSFMGVDECIASIMCYQAQEERKFMDGLYKLSMVHNPKYDAEMQFLSRLVSEHACELIYEQYVYATTRAKYKIREPVPDLFLIQHTCDEEDALDEPNMEHSVTKRDWSCSCLFMSSRLLPCRHVFFLRKTLRCENIIPTHVLNPRWLLASLRTETELPQLAGEAFGGVSDPAGVKCRVGFKP
ncbi:hypothetical protein PPTG_22939 [Phytophthora nicotianae INRA-310]|uniref:SWIM-type domain-containing protein n=1 Tax=Phytophthora nicotianae (strain INRA-310) TaxID=761204 RepID=W2Q7W7_PHYN3|nr:hypothetical protein PPTG_22939 [Phytophthora nicotianae INRA-310]ETN08659.1 hypothetical protein PPTG_22939 [Phytophthora nicotianae INRA-310]